MKRGASSRSKSKSRAVKSPKAAMTGETQRISTSEELAAALRSAFNGTTSGAHVNADTAMRVAAVYACVRVLSESVAMLPIRLYKETGASRFLQAGSPLDMVVNRRPNPVHTPFDFKKLIVRSLLLRGNFYALKSMWNSPMAALIPLHPDRMSPATDDKTFGMTYTYRPASGGERVFAASEIVHLRGMSSDGFVGTSVIQAAAEAIGLSLTAEKHGARMLGNGANPSGVLRHPQQLSGEAAKRLRDTFDEKFGGSDNAGRTLLLEEGMTWDKIGMTSEESQFIENRKFQRSEIAMFFGVPPHMIGDVERGTSWGSGIEQQGIGFVTYTLLPWLTNIVQGLERDLIPAKDQAELSYHFVTDELIRADFNSRQQGREVQFRNGVISANEWRQQEGLNPRSDPGGEAYSGPASAAPAAKQTPLAA